LAIPFALAPPAVVKFPPAYSAGPEPSSKTANASAFMSNPAPSGCQFDPFQRATWSAFTPLTAQKNPLMYSAGPEPSSSAATVVTVPFTPALPAGTPLQVEPSQRANSFTCAAPALWNSPPA
jgi:hypothetical protein